MPLLPWFSPLRSISDSIMAQSCEKKATGLLTCCDSRKCLPLPTFKPGIPDTREWILYECLFPIPNRYYLLRIPPAFSMVGLSHMCHRLGFIHSTTVCREPSMFRTRWMSVAQNSSDFCPFLPSLQVNSGFFCPVSLPKKSISGYLLKE